jgi:hypothetical protein
MTIRAVEFDLDEPLVRLAHRAYVRKRVGMTLARYLWAPVSFLVIGGLFLLGGETMYYAGMTVIGVGIALWIYTGGVIWRLYHRKVRDTLEHINRMSRPHFRFEFSDEGVSSKTELSSGQLAWKAFRELYRTPEVWLLFITKTRYVIFPTASVPADVQHFILTKCGEHKIPVS